MKNKKEFSINLKLKERERIKQKIEKEDRKFKEIAIQIFILLGVIYTIAFTNDNYNNEHIQYVMDILLILLAPSLCLGIIISAVTSIIKQCYMQDYIMQIEKDVNKELNKVTKITFFEDWNKKKDMKKKELYFIHGI